MAQANLRKLQDESFMAFLDMLFLNLPRPRLVASPMLVLGAARDMIFSPAEVEATARAYQAQAALVPEMAHDMMNEKEWKSVAEYIRIWLNQRGI